MVQFTKICDSLDKLFWTSDTHAFHKNITKGVTTWEYPHNLGCRDFEDEIKMTNLLIENINKTVGEDDVLVHAGDWSFGGKQKIKEFKDALICKNIYLIKGNHDHNITQEYALDLGFKDFQDIGYYKCEGIIFFVSHYPNVVWHQSHKGCIGIYGHCHNSYNHLGKAIDVGMDSAFAKLGEYRPFTSEEIIKYCSNRLIIEESHHNPNTN